MPLLLLLLALAAPAAARPASCTDGITAPEGVFCDSVDECVRYCSCACTFDPKKWTADKRDQSTTCTLPRSGPGMVPPDSADLVPVSSTLPYVAVPRGLRATADARDGLIALSAALSASAKRAERNYSVRVGSCYRRHETDSEPECGYVLKGNYMIGKSTTDAKREYWREKANPMNLGLAWPGRTPHSGGYACDVILVDANGRDCFDWRAGAGDPPTCAIAAREASSLLDEEMAGTGALRLSYEAWHYEWGPNAKGCRHPDCAAKYWPLTGKPGNRP